MAIDTFMAYVGGSNSVSDADADFELVQVSFQGRPDRRL